MKGRETGQSQLRFECTSCGKCCRARGEYAYVYLNRDEEGALADFLGMTVATFRRRCTWVDEDGFRQLTFSGDRCVFLDDVTQQCTVYPARPTQCRTFPFWGEMVDGNRWTHEARRLCEGVGRGRLYSIEEAEDLMLERELSEVD
ncbi:MAG: YkgJ family cysteine cluster protein [Myxococcota bacterium]